MEDLLCEIKRIYRKSMLACPSAYLKFFFYIYIFFFLTFSLTSLNRSNKNKHLSTKHFFMPKLLHIHLRHVTSPCHWAKLPEESMKEQNIKTIFYANRLKCLIIFMLFIHSLPLKMLLYTKPCSLAGYLLCVMFLW